MGKIMEAVFCIAYLFATGALGIAMLRTASGNKQRFCFGFLALVHVGMLMIQKTVCYVCPLLWVTMEQRVGRNFYVE